MASAIVVMTAVVFFGNFGLFPSLSKPSTLGLQVSSEVLLVVGIVCLIVANYF